MLITTQTLRIAGETELGPLQEKRATLVAIGWPTSVSEGLIFALGTLQNKIKILMYCEMKNI